MSATVTFAADFSTFSEALDRATLKLRTFGLEPSKVEKALNKIGDSFSGQKIISEATLSARAIAEMGEKGDFASGLLKLTTAELQRAGTQAREAANKMKALGIEVPPNIERLAKAIEPIPRQLTLAEKAAGLAKTTFGQMFGAFSAANLVDKAIGTIVSFGKEAFNSAGRIVDLSAKLNISTDAIQRWEFVAKQTGATLEDFSSNAFKLGVRLSGGAGSVQNAVKELGLSFQQLRTLKPEDQFDTVVSKLGDMEDATKRNAIGVALFGKGFESIASSVAQGYADIAKGASKSTEQQLQALDKAGDEWDKLTDRIGKATQGALASILHFSNEALKGILFEGNKKPTGDIKDLIDPRLGQSTIPIIEDYVAQLKAAKDALAALTPEQRKQIDAALELGVKLDDLSAQYGIEVEVLALYKTAMKTAETATKNTTKAVAEMKTPLLEAKASMLSLATAMPEVVRSLDEGLPVLASWNEIIEKQPLDLTKFKNALYALPPAIKSVGVELEETTEKVGTFQTDLANINDAFRTLAQVSGDSWGGVAQDIARVTGAIDLAQRSVEQFKKGGLGNQVAGILGGIAAIDSATASGSRGSRVLGGAAAGAAVGSLAGPIGTAVGAGVGALIGVFRGQSAGERLNDVRDAAIAAAGGFEALNTKAHMAGTTLARVLNARTVTAYEAAWKDLQETLGETEADTVRLQAAIEKYGFTIEQLGPTLQKQELDKQAKELIEDWRVLVAGGIDMTVVNEKMASTISEYLQTAIKVGAEVPAAMKPILQSMIDQGTLVDANGQAITDLEDAGVSFSETMTEGFDRVVKKLDELIERLQGAGKAIDDIPKSIAIDTRYTDPGPGNYWKGEPDTMPAYASGTRGRFLDFGAGTPVLLHGRERVMTEAEGRAQGGGALESIASALDGIDRRISTAVSRAVTDALILAPGWR